MSQQIGLAQFGCKSALCRVEIWVLLSSADFERAKVWVMLMGVFSGPPAPANRRSILDLGLVAAIITVALYALLVGILILSGRIAPEGAYWLLALPCLVPAVWYLYGFLRADGSDSGLILSALGWFFAALTFFLKHLTIRATLASGVLPDSGSDSPLSYLCAFLAVAGIVGGAVVSGRNWMNRSSS